MAGSTSSIPARPRAVVPRPALSATRVLRRPLGRFELFLCVALIAVLAGTGIRHMTRLMADAEQASMIATLSNVRRALMLEALAHLVHGDLEAVAGLRDANPMQVLDHLPPNYAGVHDDGDAAGVPGGSWYFDPALPALVYRAAHAQRFESALAGPPRARFRVRLAFDDADGDGRFEPRTDSFTGIGLEPLEPWRWRAPD